MFQDGTSSTFFKKGGSRSGLILRYVDEKNYLLLLVDGASGEAVLTSVRDGKARCSDAARATFSDAGRSSESRRSGPSVKASLGDARSSKGPIRTRWRARRHRGRGPGRGAFDELVFESAEIK